MSYAVLVAKTEYGVVFRLYRCCPAAFASCSFTLGWLGGGLVLVYPTCYIGALCLAAPARNLRFDLVSMAPWGGLDAIRGKTYFGLRASSFVYT